MHKHNGNQLKNIIIIIIVWLMYIVPKKQHIMKWNLRFVFIMPNTWDLLLLLLPSSSSSSSLPKVIIGGIGVGDGISLFDIGTCFRNSKRECFSRFKFATWFHNSERACSSLNLKYTCDRLSFAWPRRVNNASLVAFCIAMLCAAYALDIFSMTLVMLFKAFVCSRSWFSLRKLVALEPSGCSNSVLGWRIGSRKICTWLLYN